MASSGGGTCRYGSVVGIDALLRADSSSNTQVMLSSVDAALGACDECEQQPARVECDDCGLVYCALCDAHRHRKGKLLFHQRQDLPTAAPATTSQDSALLQPPLDTGTGALTWSVEDVSAWLHDHDLDVFTADIMAHSVNGAFLLSSRMNEFIETHCSAASRGLKKKLVRELQKLRTDALDATSSSSSSSASTTNATALVSASQPQSLQSLQPSTSARRLGVNLRVNVHTSPVPEPQSFSPVTALRSRILHGQGDETKGRINRRRSAVPASPASPADTLSTQTSSSVSSVAGLDEPKRSKSVLFAPSQLRIDVSEKALLVQPTELSQPLQGRLAVSPPQIETQASAWPRHETRPSGRTDLRSMRQALGGLDLDIGQVKREERSVTASFDFSAEGRLQTQGFEINTHGIATAPFPHEHPSKRTAMGTREYLVVLNELGHGAGGKVYRALYVPTFKLVAVKVIRVFDQKKRHQMVRELKSLYANFVAIHDTASRAACDELVVFYDAYTNPEIGSVSIVLELMDRGSLEDHLQSGRRVSERELATMAHCVLKGLAFLHEHHQLHRDIKLSNMLINHQGHVKISDFGISRDLESTLAKATTFTGTLLYMAPERISGGMYSYPSDIWSFGLAIMALAIGKLPVPTKEGYWGVVHAVQEQPSPRLADYGDHFSPALCDFIDQCLQKNPMHRPPAVVLLEHAFLKENYVPPSKTTAPPGTSSNSSSRAMFSGDNGAAPVTAAAPTDAKLHELEHMVAQVRTWCRTHADTLLSPTAATTASSESEGGSALLHRISNQTRVTALAHQLHLPVETVASQFAFLDEYCT